jgi:mono/diheme cytochrome c family protein
MDLRRPLGIISIIFLLSSFLFVGCGGQENSKEKRTEPDGERIYRDRCASCHGANGKKGVSGAKDLTRSKLSMKERIEIIKNGKGAMIPFEGTLNEQEIRAVAEYLEHFKESG